MEIMEEVTIEMKEKKLVICRICLKYDIEDTSQSLFEMYKNSFIYEKINYIASIEVEAGDDLPDKICSSCLKDLDNACIFKEKCEHSDAVLRATLPLNEIVPGLSEDPVKVENTDDYIDADKPSPYNSDINEDEDPINNNTLENKLDSLLECDGCGVKLKSKCKMRVHWKKVHQPQQLTCPSCNKTMRTFKSYHSHIKKQSKSCKNASKMRIEGKGHSRIYHCTLCDAQSNRIQTILTHLVIHTGERPFSCDLCDRTFTQHSSLTAHKESIHKLYSKEGTCHQCGKHFKGRNKLYRHMKTHSIEQISCKICFKVLKSKSTLQQHMKRHSGVKSFTCEFCAKTFYTSSDLANHKSQRHYKRKVYSCEQCEYKTKNCTSISKHRRRHRANNVACDVCGIFVDNIQQLELHKKRHFEKNFECLYCNKKYYGRKNLTAHIRKKHNMFAVSDKTTVVNKIKTIVKKS